MTSTKQMSLASFFFLLLTTFHAALANKHHSRRPCKNLIFYFHDIIYNGQNSDNATSAIVGEPAWGNKTILANQDHFGNVVVFDDPITLDNNLHSTPVGRAQGFYLYDRKDLFASWVGFSFVFNSTQHMGSINFAGANAMTNKTRDVSVIGGTGDFLMARGVATFRTDAVEGELLGLMLLKGTFILGYMSISSFMNVGNMAWDDASWVLSFIFYAKI